MNFDKESFHPFTIELTSLSPAVDQVVDVIENSISVPFKRNLRPMITIILMNLYLAHSAGKDCVMYSRDKGIYKAKSMYNGLFVSENILPLIDAMGEAGFLHLFLGRYDKDTGKGKRSRMVVAPKLLRMLHGFNPDMPMISLDTETVILRRTEKVRKKKGYRNVKHSVEYHHTAYTRKVKAFLKEYNTLLQDKMEDKTLIMNRIFSQNSFKLGGRFYLRYQNWGKAERAVFPIDGEIVAEPDFDGLHIMLMYAMIGVDWYKDGYKDPYELDIEAIGLSEGETTRDVLKRLLLIATNCDSRRGAILALHGQRREAYLPKIENLKELLTAFELKHPLLLEANQFYSSTALKLHRLDSDIMYKILIHFTKMKELIIPVHDSAMIRGSLREQLIEVMKDSANTTLVEYGYTPVTVLVDGT